MGVDEFLDEKLGIKKPKKEQNSTPRTPRTKKVVVPKHIKNLFDNIDKSISSAWGMQKDGKIKWDAKYNQWVSFKLWFEELSK